jgi:hypothetical protein
MEAVRELRKDWGNVDAAEYEYWLEEREKAQWRFKRHKSWLRLLARRTSPGRNVGKSPASRPRPGRAPRRVVRTVRRRARAPASRQADDEGEPSDIARGAV